MRNVLAHNGPSLNVLLRHVAALLRPDGHLLSAEPDVTGLVIPGHGTGRAGSGAALDHDDAQARP